MIDIGLYQKLNFYEIQENYLNKFNHNYVSALNDILTKKGQSLSFADIPDDVMINKLVSKDKSHTSRNMLMKARDIDCVEYEEVCRAIKKTEIQKIELDRYRLKNRILGVTVLTDDLLCDYLDNKSKVLAQLHIIDNSGHTCDAEYDNFDEKIIQKKEDIYVDIMKKLGVEFGDTKEFEPSVFEELMKKVTIDKNTRSLFKLEKVIKDWNYSTIKAMPAT